MIHSSYIRIFAMCVFWGGVFFLTAYNFPLTIAKCVLKQVFYTTLDGDLVTASNRSSSKFLRKGNKAFLCNLLLFDCIVVFIYHCWKH